jgi:lia operon protein LiaG
MARRSTFAGALVLLTVGGPSPPHAQERYAVGGEHVAIYNLAGEIEVVGTRSGQVTVDVARGGRDADDLRVEVGRLGAQNTLRVIHPSGRIVYPGRGWRGTTQLRVRADGTWGGPGGERGESVRISSRGSGTEAWADLRIGVPRGQRVDVHLGVGRFVAENVDGELRFQTGSGAVEARRMSGHMTIRTGSGAVRVEGMDGPLVIGTGSGRVRISNVGGDSVSIRTGSGAVSGDRVAAAQVRIRTGSGRVELRGSASRDVHLNTGSGSVTAELVAAVDEVRVRTGSGSVRLHLSPDLDAAVTAGTGSGRIEFDFPLRVTRQARRELHGVAGGGNGSINVSTGSGSIRLRRI